MSLGGACRQNNNNLPAIACSPPEKSPPVMAPVIAAMAAGAAATMARDVLEARLDAVLGLLEETAILVGAAASKAAGCERSVFAPDG